MIDREIDLSGLKLQSSVMIGAGPIKTVEQAREIAESNSGLVLIGSITLEERVGNSGTTYFADKNHNFSINSKGLPNPGLEYYKKNLPEMVKIAHEYGKPLIVSIAGFSPEEYAHLSEEIMRCGVDGQEINLGCPNVWKDGKQKRIASFDPDLTGEILMRVESAVGVGVWTSIKVSPYSDPTLLEIMATIINNSAIVNAVTVCNTFPNTFSLDSNDQPAITPAGGLGGLSGRAIKPIVMGQVVQWKEILDSNKAIIASGGAEIERDVKDYLMVGAKAVQKTTDYINRGAEAFKIIS